MIHIARLVFHTLKMSTPPPLIHVVLTVLVFLTAAMLVVVEEVTVGVVVTLVVKIINSLNANPTKWLFECV